mgnify:FL=1
MNTKETKRSRNANIAIMAMFTAIIVIMAFTPFGMIQLPLIKATIIHIPVIIGGILLGPKGGIYFGSLFGLVSFIANTITPSALSFAFSPLVAVPGTGVGSPWALLVCFGPRILTAVTPWLFYTGMKKIMPAMKEGVRAVMLAISGAIGAITNTALVMGLIYILFKDAYAGLKGIPVTEVKSVVLGVVAANGIPEAIVAAIVTPVVCMIIFKITKSK